MGSSFSNVDTAVARRNELFFWGFAVVVLFLFLGHNALWGSEDRWAEITREMMLSGDYLHPSLNWQVYFDKPQLSYWLIVPFAWMAGVLNEWIVRLPSALAGLAGLYGTITLGRKLFDRRTALLSGWLLLTCYGFLFWSRSAAADVANLAAIVLAVSFFYHVEEKAGFWSYLGFYLICFVGALAKGLPALVMPFVVIAPHLITGKRFLHHLKFSNLLAFLIAGAIYFLPFYAAAVQPLEFPHRLPPGIALSGLELVWRENIVRVFNAFDHKDPIYSYLYNLPRILLPWALLIGVSIAGLVRHWKKLPPQLRELMIGTLLMFILFSLSTSRRWYYILPLAPFCALLGAVGLVTGAGMTVWNRPVVALMRILVIVAASLGVASVVAIPLWYRMVDIELPLMILISLPTAGILTLLVMLADGQPNNLVSRLTGLPERLGAMVLGCAILVATVFDCVLPALTLYRTERPFFLAVRTVASDIPPEAMLFWNDDVDSKYLFYLNLAGPACDTWQPLSEEEEARVKAASDPTEARNRANLRRFVSANAGRRVVLLSYNREKDLVPLEKAVREFGIPLDIGSPTITEREFEKIKIRRGKSSSRSGKTWSAWIFQLPQAFENPSAAGE